MSDEDLLRAALCRESPPAAFSARVLARVEQQRRPYAPRWAAAVLLALLSGAAWRHRQEQQQGERARTQLLQALQLTSRTLQHVQHKVREVHP